LANHKSALKRARQSAVRQARNSISKTKIKNAIKKTAASLDGSAAETALALKKAMSMLHKAASRGTIHPRNAARRISRLSKRVFQAQSAAEG
jgi:small subunit ribosomal protein S20